MADGKLKEFLMNKTGVGNSLRLQNELAAFASIKPPKSPEQLKQDEYNKYRTESAKYQAGMAELEYNQAKANVDQYGTVAAPKPVVPKKVSIPIGDTGAAEIEIGVDNIVRPTASTSSLNTAYNKDNRS